MTNKFLALTIVLVLAAGFAAVSAEPPQTFSEDLSLGMEIERNSIHSFGFAANVPMFEGANKFYLGTGAVSQSYGPYSQKDSFLSVSSVFYPKSGSFATKLKDWPPIFNALELENDFYQLRGGFGGKVFLESTRGELVFWDYPNLYGGVYGIIAGELKIPLDITKITVMKNWDTTIGFHWAPGIISEPPYYDVQNAWHFGLRYNF